MSGRVSRSETRRVLFVDTDAGGRIHFTAALRWAEAVEHRLLRELEPGCEIGTWPRRRVEAEYLAPLGFDDEIVVRLEVARVGATSVSWTWTISRDDVVCVAGAHTTVHVGPDGVPAPASERLRARLQEHQG